MTHEYFRQKQDLVLFLMLICGADILTRNKRPGNIENKLSCLLYKLLGVGWDVWGVSYVNLRTS